MQDELSIEKARVAILVEERNELLRKVFELEEQVRRLTQRARDGACTSCKLELTPQCPIRTGNGCDLYQPRQ